MPTFLKRLLGVIVIAILLFALNAFLGGQGLFGFGAPPYYSRIVMLAGIIVILAVSLNLITGFTGQFSIGHAGFMAGRTFLFCLTVRLPHHPSDAGSDPIS